MSEDVDAAGEEIDVWPAFADLFSALSFILLLLVIVNVRQTRGVGGGDGGVSTSRNRLLQKLATASDSGRLFTIDAARSEIRLSLPDAQTFPSGTHADTSIKPSGRSAIAKVATILGDDSLAVYYSTVHVVGHTDQEPVTAGTLGFQDNWDLSARRAVTVARLMLESGRVDPCVLRATGAGPYHPLDTAVARANPAAAENRRVTIVIFPRVRGDVRLTRSCFRRGDGSIEVP